LLGSVITFDPDSLRERTAVLEQEMGSPGFWDDQQRAASVSAEQSRLTKRLDRYQRLTREYEDARDLLAMDSELEDEIVETIAPLRKELERLQEDALFSGHYDAGEVPARDVAVREVVQQMAFAPIEREGLDADERLALSWFGPRDTRGAEVRRGRVIDHERLHSPLLFLWPHRAHPSAEPEERLEGSGKCPCSRARALFRTLFPRVAPPP